MTGLRLYDIVKRVALLPGHFGMMYRLLSMGRTRIYQW
jgi:hypothetical protein